MKKKYLAAAILAALAGSAMAAQVTLYGLVDTGLDFTRTKAGNAESQNSFSQRSGIQYIGQTMSERSQGPRMPWSE